jgi:hypothetical protein
MKKVHHSVNVVELTDEDCERLALEAERYRKEISPRLNRLSHMTEEDWKTKVG